MYLEHSVVAFRTLLPYTYTNLDLHIDCLSRQSCVTSSKTIVYSCVQCKTLHPDGHRTTVPQSLTDFEFRTLPLQCVKHSPQIRHSNHGQNYCGVCCTHEKEGVSEVSLEQHVGKYIRFLLAISSPKRYIVSYIKCAGIGI